jgi:hypothetical protein
MKLTEEKREAEIMKYMNDLTVRAVDRYYSQMQAFINQALNTHCPRALRMTKAGWIKFAKFILAMKRIKVQKATQRCGHGKVETWIEIIKHGQVVARNRFVLKIRKA